MLTNFERKKCLNTFLYDKFPSKIYAFILGYHIIIGLFMIIIQTVLTLVKGPCYKTEVGIWCGLIIIIIQAILMILSNN